MADLTDFKVYKNNRFQILTDTGFKDFTGIIKGKNIEKIIIDFTENNKIICTPKHKFIINDNIVYAKDLKIGDIINKYQIINIKNCINNDDVYEFLNIDNHKYLVNDLLSHQCLIIDEAAHIEPHKEKEFFNSVMPVISSSKNTKIVLISTPLGTNNNFYKIYFDSLQGKNSYVVEKIMWNDIPKRDEEWRKIALADMGGDIQRFKQEYEVDFSTGEEGAVDKSIIEDLRTYAKKPEILDSQNYKIWEVPDPKSIYVMGVDVSDGVGQAASVIQGFNITDLTDIKQAFVYHNNKIEPYHFAEEIHNIANQWGRPPILIERNAMGGQVVDPLVQNFHYERLISYDSDNKVDANKYGINSNVSVKYSGVINMRYWVNTLRCVSIYDISTIEELNTFVKHGTNQWAKASGNNIYDDRVMSMVWALFILHTPLTYRYFDVNQLDERGKPLKITSNYDSDPTTFNLDLLDKYQPVVKNDDVGSIMFNAGNASTFRDAEMETLSNDGWFLA